MARIKSLIVAVALSSTAALLFLTFSYNHESILTSDCNRDLVASLGGNLVIESSSFPEKIWQSWKDDSKDPTPRTVGFPRKWRTLNPDHRYERITDANSNAYVEDNFSPNISRIFNDLDDPILRADFLRYLVMVLEGVIWADINVLPHQPISSWIPDIYKNATNLVVGIENDKHKSPIWPGSPYSIQLAQYTILAKPNHPALLKLVESVSQKLARFLEAENPPGRVSFSDVMSMTGPFAFTNVMMEYFTDLTAIKHNGDELDRIQEPVLIGDVLVLPIDRFGWLPQNHVHELGDPSILIEHLFIGSWRAGHPG
ncbi:glycosyltransferase family 32 protein [Xylariaceae sp. FL1272]|nr:glycosyltransferase family 32 protein [Xylariaceae sp. FL1272]